MMWYEKMSESTNKWWLNLDLIKTITNQYSSITQHMVILYSSSEFTKGVTKLYVISLSALFR